MSNYLNILSARHVAILDRKNLPEQDWQEGYQAGLAFGRDEGRRQVKREFREIKELKDPNLIIKNLKAKIDIVNTNLYQASHLYSTGDSAKVLYDEASRVLLDITQTLDTLNRSIGDLVVHILLTTQTEDQS